MFLIEKRIKILHLPFVSWKLFSGLLASDLAFLQARAGVLFLETNYDLCFHPSSFKYWVGQTVCSTFSVPSCKKTWMNFLANPISQRFSMSFKMKVKHPCMAYTILYNLALLDLISPSPGSWRPFIWSYSLFLWFLSPHWCHTLASWTPPLLPAMWPTIVAPHSRVNTGSPYPRNSSLTQSISYRSGAPYIGSEERFIIETKEVKANDNMQYTMVSQ